jgi:hypothetical protein
LFSISANGKGIADGGFYAVQSFKTAIAKPVLYEVPNYLALNFNLSNKRKNKKKKSDGKIRNTNRR